MGAGCDFVVATLLLCGGVALGCFSVCCGAIGAVGACVMVGVVFCCVVVVGAATGGLMVAIGAAFIVATVGAVSTGVGACVVLGFIAGNSSVTDCAAGGLGILVDKFFCAMGLGL